MHKQIIDGYDCFFICQILFTKHFSSYNKTFNEFGMTSNKATINPIIINVSLINLWQTYIISNKGGFRHHKEIH